MLNPSVLPEHLPSLVALQKQRLSPKFATLSAGMSVALMWFLAVTAIIIDHFKWLKQVGSWDLALAWLPVALFSLGVCLGLYRLVADKAKFYALREHDISYFSGVFFKKLVTQPISRIQHVEVSQGPLERVAGLAKLQVYSAGSGLQTFAIPGLPHALAHQIRQSLTEKLVVETDELESDGSKQRAR